jgi:hypothetical protein
MLYANLVPGRPRMAERLAVGLGLPPAPAAPPLAHLPSRRTSPRTSSRTSLRSWFVTAAAAATCLALLVIGRQGPAPEGEYGVRGLASDETGAALEVYRITPGAAPQPSEGWMAAGDELVFAYRNPTGFARLMVFGLDDRGGIYWFHPAWTDPAQDPVAVPIDAGVGPFELREAIRHQVRGSGLRIVALFMNAALSVRALEDGVRTGRPEPPGSARFETLLEVRR